MQKILDQPILSKINSNTQVTIMTIIKILRQKNNTQKKVSKNRKSVKQI